MKESSYLPIAKCGLSLLLFWATYVFMAIAIWWPEWSVRLFRSRWAVAYLAVCCGVACVWFHKPLRSGLAQGYREFQKATDQVTKEILDALFGKWW